MTTGMGCGRVAEGTVERYLAGDLNDDETAAFEQHFLGCEACQRELEFQATVRDALAPPAGAPDAASARGTKRWTRWRVAGATGAVLAAGIALAVLLLRPGDPSAIQRLGMVEQPPIYLGVALRGETTQADSLVAAAMEDYVAGDYERAAAGLRQALDAGAPPLPVRFYLAASLLMAGEAEAASRRFEEVIAVGASPYEPEARYYLAKALLQQGDAEAAAAQLRMVGQRLDDTATAARELLAALEEVAAASPEP